jgi:hypothetical protein
MTRRQSLTVEQIRMARAAYVPGRFGYGAVAKLVGAPVSTVRDALAGVTAYATRVRN